MSDVSASSGSSQDSAIDRAILAEHLRNRGRIANATMDNNTIDGIISESNPVDIENARRRLVGSKGVSGQSDAGMAMLPTTAYNPGPRKDNIDYSAMSKYDKSRNQLRDGVWSTIRQIGNRRDRTFFYDIQKYSADEMYEKISNATDMLNEMDVAFQDVMKFLNEHTGRVYRRNIELKVRGQIGSIQHTCAWIRETLECLESGKIPSSEAGKIA